LAKNELAFLHLPHIYNPKVDIRGKEVCPNGHQNATQEVFAPPPVPIQYPLGSHFCAPSAIEWAGLDEFGPIRGQKFIQKWGIFLEFVHQSNHHCLKKKILKINIFSNSPRRIFFAILFRQIPQFFGQSASSPAASPFPSIPPPFSHFQMQLPAKLIL
jgi:hypothetical protein